MNVKSLNSSQSGFVLVMAIGALLVLTLIVSAVAINVQGLVTIAQDKKTQEQLLWDSTSVRSRVIYAMLTGHKTFHGFSHASTAPPLDDMGELIPEPTENDLRVDGRWYLMNGFPFSIQDKAGLLNANTISEYEFTQLFSGQVNRDSSPQEISQQYRDFIDFDDRKRFLGAESFSYESQYMPGPINRSLFLSQEMKQILTWPDTLIPWEVFRTDQLYWNLNTAPKSVLSIKTASTETDLGAFLSHRENSFLTGFSKVEEILGLGTVLGDNESIVFSISNRFRVGFIVQNVCVERLENEECSFSTNQLLNLGDVRIQIVDLFLSPNDDNAPFRIDKVKSISLYQYLLSRELAYPLRQDEVNLILDTFNNNSANIGPISAGFFDNSNNTSKSDINDALPIRDLIKIKDTPIIEYEYQNVSL